MEIGMNIGMTCRVWLALVSIAWAAQAIAGQWELGVVTQSGAVWVWDVNATTVGPGVKLSGPSLFGGPGHIAALGRTDDIDILSASGDLWAHFADRRQVGAGRLLAGGPLTTGASRTKYVLFDDLCSIVYTVGADGSMWASPMLGNRLAPSTPMQGAKLFAAGQDRFVVLGGATTVYVIDTAGTVIRHELFNAMPEAPCPGSVGEGAPLPGAGLFGGPSRAKYVVFESSRFLVVDVFGAVWSYPVANGTVGAGLKLAGPPLFAGIRTPGRDADVYVVAFQVTGPSRSRIVKPNNGL
jgi:hypothetical protein